MRFPYYYSRLSVADALLYREAKARRSMEQDYVFSTMDSGSEWLNCMNSMAYHVELYLENDICKNYQKQYAMKHVLSINKVGFFHILPFKIF